MSLAFPCIIAGVFSGALRGGFTAARAFAHKAIVLACAFAIAEILDNTFARRVSAWRGGVVVVAQALARVIAGVLCRALRGGFAAARAFGHEAIVRACAGSVAEVLIDAFAPCVSTLGAGVEVVAQALPRVITSVLVGALRGGFTAARAFGYEAIVCARASPIAEVLIDTCTPGVTTLGTGVEVVAQALPRVITSVLVGALRGGFTAARAFGYEAIVCARASPIAEVLIDTCTPGVTTLGTGVEVVAQALARVIAGVLSGALRGRFTADCTFSHEAIVGARAGPVAEVRVDACTPSVSARSLLAEIVGETLAGSIAGVLP